MGPFEGSVIHFDMGSEPSYTVRQWWFCDGVKLRSVGRSAEPQSKQAYVVGRIRPKCGDVELRCVFVDGEEVYE